MSKKTITLCLTIVLSLGVEAQAGLFGGGGFGGGGFGGGGFRGGFGGGGFRGGGFGGGGFRGGGRPILGGGRPVISRPIGPSFSRPSGPIARPGPVLGSRPAIGSRPAVGGGPVLGSRPPIVNRPAIRPTPAARPGIGPGIANRPAIGNLPAQPPLVGAGIGNRPALGGGPGIGQLPSGAGGPIAGIGGRPSVTLPGLGPAGIGGGANRPAAGMLPILANRPALAIDGPRPALGERRAWLNDLMRHDHRDPGNIENISDRWHNWREKVYDHHRRWYHGSWPGRWGLGGRLEYWWNRYPVMTTIGVTTWAINRIRWAFGYDDYYNPYYDSGRSGYDYSEPLTATPIDQSLSSDPSDTQAQSGVSQKALDLFNQAQQKFRAKDYEGALALTDDALKEMPTDAVIHEFRALCLFSLGRYPDAAAALYAVLAVGPGWDWTTMNSLFADTASYTVELRKLEAHRKSNPDDAAARFVLAYHYITCGHNQSAIAELQQVLRINPKDQLAASILQQLDPNAKVPQPEITKPPENSQPVPDKQLVGTWKAKRESGAEFEMKLGEDGAFSWKYTAGDKTQEVRGVWAVDAKGVLALELNDQGTMLAQLDKKSDSKFDFYMIGNTSGSQPLHFEKQG